MHLLRATEAVKLRFMIGLTAARRTAAMADRWRNIVRSIVCGGCAEYGPIEVLLADAVA